MISIIETQKIISKGTNVLIKKEKKLLNYFYFDPRLLHVWSNWTI